MSPVIAHSEGLLIKSNGWHPTAVQRAAFIAACEAVSASAPAHTKDAEIARVREKQRAFRQPIEVVLPGAPATALTRAFGDTFETDVSSSVKRR